MNTNLPAKLSRYRRCTCAGATLTIAALAATLQFKGFQFCLGQTAAPQSAPVVAEAEVVPPAKPATPAEKKSQAWKILSDAAADKRPDTRIQALAALGTLADVRSTGLIVSALADPDVDVRTAAVLASGQVHSLVSIGKLHGMLNDKEPAVAFAAANTLWKLHDRAGEDILAAVADGERSANPTLINGAMHSMNREMHDPAALARMGATQGASMLLGPFGFGLGAYEAIRKNGGGNSARVTAIEDLAENHTPPIRKELLGALGDNDATVRAAAAKALGAYPERAVSDALYRLFTDPKPPVRFTAAAAYLRTVGVAISKPTMERH